MSTDWPSKFPEEHKPRPTSGLTKVLIGCGVVVLLGGVLACGGIIFGVRYGMAQLDKLTAEYEAKGYTKVAGQVFEVSASPSTPTVYLGQVLTIKGDIHVDLAAVVQVMEVDAKIDGDLDFMGQLLHIKPNGVITGNVRVKGAQQIVVEGQVLGEITGSYTNLADRRPAVSAPASPASAERVHDSDQH